MNSDIKICIDKCEICINTRNNDNNYDSFLRSTPFSYYTNPFSRRVPQPPVASSSTSPFNTQNTTTSVREVFNNLVERDHLDSTRADSPLVQAEDAILLDATQFTVESMQNHVLDLVAKRLG